MQKNKNWFTISEAAKYLGVSPDTLRRWEKAGKINSPIRTAGGARRYSKELLEEILAAGKKKKISQLTPKPKVKSQALINKKTFLIGLIATLVTLAILLPIIFLLF